MISSISLLVKIGILFLILFTAIFFILRDALLLLPSSFKSLQHIEENRVIVTNLRGNEFLARILPSSVVLPFLVIINIKIEGHYLDRSIVMLTSSDVESELRRWKVHLIWYFGKEFKRPIKHDQ
jgi:uncharacterized membrane protein YkvI